MIEVQNIMVRKNGKNIIKNICFSLSAGAITVAIGKNGAGKSTLLEALAGNNPLKSGQVLWNKRPLAQWKMQELATQRAVLSQRVEVNFSIAVHQLVEMGTYAAALPLPKREIDQLVKAALTQVEMTAFAKRDFRTLSGGEQKRVLLAKCLVQLNSNPHLSIDKYLLLDEPTASLDVQQQFKLLTLIKKIVCEQNIGVFAILHDINLAAQVADQILLMQLGEVIAQGNTNQVLTTKNIRTTLGIEALIQPHPTLDCPYVLPLPTQKNSTISL